MAIEVYILLDVKFNVRMEAIRSNFRLADIDTLKLKNGILIYMLCYSRYGKNINSKVL